MRFTGRAEGDLGHGGEYVQGVRPDVEARRRAVLDRPWSWLRQIHGSAVAVVEGPGDHAGAVADASVTADAGAALAILTADCAPIALASPEGVIGVVHAGWRGVLAGVIPAAIDVMRARGSSNVIAALGPCIHHECYEFGMADLERFDPAVRSTTATGAPALDLPAAVRLALRESGAALDYDADACTACGGGFFSHRARQERERQAVVAWVP